MNLLPGSRLPTISFFIRSAKFRFPVPGLVVATEVGAEQVIFLLRLQPVGWVVQAEPEEEVVVFHS